MGEKNQAPPISQKQTKLEIIQEIADKVGLRRKQVLEVFDAVMDMLYGHLHPDGSGEFTLPGTGIKVRRVKKQASESRKMMSPITGGEIFVKAKPERYAIKLIALNVLKHAVNQFNSED